MEASAIPAANQMPVMPTILKAFVATLVGEYLALTIKIYINGVRARHIIHSLSWQGQDIELKALYKATHSLASASSKKSPQEPWTKNFIIKIHSQLNLNDPIDAAVYACLTTSFYSTSQLGEFTQKKLKDFDARVHISPRNVHQDIDRHGYECVVFHLPSTKLAQHKGEDVSWARQDDVSDPEAAYDNHRQVNAFPNNGALCAYQYQKGWKELTKTKFPERTSKAALACQLTPLQGHGIQIRAVLEYLLQGMPFKVMKSKGCWAGDSFEKYL